MPTAKKVSSLASRPSVKELIKASAASVLIRDLEGRIFEIPLNRLEEFRNKRMEANRELIKALDEGKKIDQLQNAWLIQYYSTLSGA